MPQWQRASRPRPHRSPAHRIREFRNWLPQVKGGSGLKLEQDDIVDLTHGAEADINICKPDPEQTDPRPQHMTGIQATDAVICLGTSGRLGFGVQEPANEVPERMTAKGVKTEENGVQNQDE